jgi:pimeloyl-ACP methyl ester carboxylesterase
MHGTGNAGAAIFTFASFVNPGRQKPPYAFMQTCLQMRAARGVECDVYYFLSNTNDWYFSGVRGLGSFADSIEALRHIRTRYRRTVYLGNSMGGFAALAFGFLTGATRIIAFSTLSRLDREFMTSIDDRRWKDDIAKIQDTYPVHSLILESLILNSASENTKAFVYVGKDSRQDLAHADCLRGLPGLTINKVDGAGHDLAHDMREDGELERILFENIQDARIDRPQA